MRLLLPRRVGLSPLTLQMSRQPARDAPCRPISNSSQRTSRPTRRSSPTITCTTARSTTSCIGLLIEEAPNPFVFVDIACGTASGSSAALRGAPVSRYIGVDNSQPSLDEARKELIGLPCPVDLRLQDFVEAARDWSEPADVIWVGQSLHHLSVDAKQRFMRDARRILSANGLFLIWESTCLEGEDREGWMERFRAVQPLWPSLSDEEFSAFDRHHKASDYPETAATWLTMGRNAGFAHAEEIFRAPNGLARIYRFGA